MNRWHHMSLFLPFTRDHICFYSCVTKRDYLSAGREERVQRQQWMPEAMVPMLEQLWKTKLQEKPAPRRGPAPVAQLRPRGLLGDRCTVRDASSHQPLQSLSPQLRGCKRARDLCELPGSAAKGAGRAKPRQNPRRRPKQGEKKKNQICIG